MLILFTLFLIYCLVVKYDMLIHRTEVATGKVEVTDTTCIKAPYFIPTNNHMAWHQYVKEIDVSGLIGGIITLLIGIYLSLEIERRNKKKEVELSSNIREIDNVTKKLLIRVEGLITAPTYQEIIDNIENIINLSRERGNDLLIMNPTASFGYFLTYEVEKRLAENGFEELKKLSGVEYYHNHLEELKRIQDRKIRKNLRLCASEMERKGGNIKYITLSSDNGNGGAFNNAYLQKTIDNVFVQGFEGNTKKIELSQTYQAHLADKKVKTKFLYLAPKSDTLGNIENINDDNEVKLKFVEHLIKDQKLKIEELKHLGSKVDVRGVGDIPIQIFLSIPQKGMKKQKDDRMCLFMFVNQQTIGKIDNVTAFVSKEDFIVETFYQIFSSYWVVANQITN